MKFSTFAAIVSVVLLVILLFVSLAVEEKSLEPLAQITLVAPELSLDQPIVEFYEDLSGRITYRDFTLIFAESDNGVITLDEIWINQEIINIACDAGKDDNLENGQTCVLAGHDSIQEFLTLWLQ